MTPDREEQIEQLIRTSPLLDAAERAEWSKLLEIMNDKQVFELEKILNTPKKDTRNNLQDTNGAPSTKFQMPELSHILNAPTIEQGVSGLEDASYKQQDTNSSPNTVQTTSPTNAGRAAGSEMLDRFRKPATVAPVTSKSMTSQLSGFAKFKSKLSGILKEKELTSGHPEPELALPEHAGVQLPVLKQQEQPKAPQIVFNAPVKFEIKQEKPAKQPVPPAVPARPVALPVQPVAVVKKPVLPPVAPKPLSNITPLKPGLKQLPKFSPQQKGYEPGTARPPVPGATVPGLTDAGKLLDAKLSAFRKPESAPPSALPHFSSPMPQQTRSRSFELQDERHESGAPAHLESLDAVKKLTLTDWKNQDYNQLVQQFRKLMGKYGYFDVMFNLEHSPVYATYIDTGLKLLQEQVGFENVGKDQTGPLGKRYLTKQEFERFADMLRMVQAG